MKFDLLSIDDVATKLGVSRVQITKWLDSNRIPHVKLGGRRFVESKYAKKPKPIKPGPKAQASKPRQNAQSRK